jgi:hypothetical protein
MAKKDPTPTTRDAEPPPEEETDSVADGAAIGALIGGAFLQPVAGAIVGAAVDAADADFFGYMPKQEGAATGASPGSWTVVEDADGTVRKVYRPDGTARDAVKDLPIIGDEIDKALDAAGKGSDNYAQRLREAVEADPFVGSGSTTPAPARTPTAPGNFLPDVTDEDLKAARDKYLGNPSSGSGKGNDATLNSIAGSTADGGGSAGGGGSSSSGGEGADASGSGGGTENSAEPRDPFRDDDSADDAPTGQSGGTAEGSDDGSGAGTAGGEEEPGGGGGGATGDVEGAGPSTGYTDQDGNTAYRDSNGNWTDATGEPLSEEEAAEWEAAYQAAQNADDDDDDDEDDAGGGGGGNVSFTPDDENGDVPIEDPLGTLPTKTLKGQDDGHTDPPDDDALPAPVSGLTQADVNQERLDMFGQPPGEYGQGAGPAGRADPGTDFTSPTRGGATDPTPDADDPAQTGPTDDPFAGAATFEPTPSAGEEEAAAEDTDSASPLQSLVDATVAEDDIDLDRVYDTPTHKMVDYG